MKNEEESLEESQDNLVNKNKELSAQNIILNDLNYMIANFVPSQGMYDFIQIESRKVECAIKAYIMTLLNEKYAIHKEETQKVLFNLCETPPQYIKEIDDIVKEAVKERSKRSH